MNDNVIGVYRSLWHKPNIKMKFFSYIKLTYISF